MKHLLLTTIAAVVLVGCGESQQSVPAPETPTAEPVAEVPTLPSSSPPEAELAWLLDNSVQAGNIQVVKHNIAIGADVNSKDESGSTPLHSAADFGHKEVAELLITKGADVNAKSSDVGWTPLLGAAGKGHKEIVELLIAKGADVNAKNKSGDTPLDLAISRKQTETADLLRKHGGKTVKELKVADK